MPEDYSTYKYLLPFKVLFILCYFRHPDIKRDICKKCRIVMVNNVTKTTKIKTVKRSKCVEVKCSICGNKRHFKVGKDNTCEVWAHKPGSQLENQVKS